MRFLRPLHSVVGSTARMEAFSDAVIAIIMTILVLEMRPPELEDDSFTGVMESLRSLAPVFISFALSFFTISVFWVNHHHFFHEVDRTDGRLLWYNCFLLFFLALVPFTTAFLDDHPTVPGVVSVYCINLFFAAFAFSMMTRHALCTDGIIAHNVSDADRHENYRRSWIGTTLYAIAAVVAPWALWLSFIIMVAVPLFYISPRLLHDHENS